ncbi:MAG: NAD(P)/FAD-dependent oxidoreductase, partial [bacterium]
MAGIKKYDYLIIGNSAGGIGCIEGIRREDRKGSIAVVSDEKYHTYSRPLITHLLEGDVDRKGMEFRPRNFYTKHGTDTFLGMRAESLDLDRKTVRLRGESGRKTLRFSNLLLATGGSPFIPPIDGVDLDGVTPMSTLDQSLDVRKRLGGLANVVVLGAGLIGLKTAEALSHVVENVKVVELADRVLAPVTDGISAKMSADAFRNKGVEVILETSITEIRGNDRGKVGEVLLTNGSVLPCDLLVVAIGVRPRTELADGTDIQVAAPKAGGGFEASDNMATNIDGVYACGDAAHAHDFVTGAKRLLPLWPNAYIGGRIAGLNMAGVPIFHRWATNMNSVDFFGFPVVSAGFMEKPDRKNYRQIVRIDPGSYS